MYHIHYYLGFVLFKITFFQILLLLFTDMDEYMTITELRTRFLEVWPSATDQGKVPIDSNPKLIPEESILLSYVLIVWICKRLEKGKHPTKSYFTRRIIHILFLRYL